MLRFLPSWARGGVFLLLIFVNTLAWAVPLFALAFCKLLLTVSAWRRALDPALMWVAQRWVGVNNVILAATQDTEWVVNGVDDLDPRSWYLVSSNHQSWADILVLQRVFHRRIPFLKFFLKRELVWFPVLGLAWWALDLPFMKRYSKEVLARHPELAGRDLETTRKACRRFNETPTTILNFLEGTRFSPAKRSSQRSRYRHLLQPKAGGIALALDALGEKIDAILDVTVIYVGRSAGFWDFVSGRVSRVVVDVRRLTIPQELRDGDYVGDPAFRRRFQDWVREIWLTKDERISTLLSATE
jgi:1-acyl-sn-glycerol-3-phosphate acyltransferase